MIKAKVPKPQGSSSYLVRITPDRFVLPTLVQMPKRLSSKFDAQSKTLLSSIVEPRRVQSRPFSKAIAVASRPVEILEALEPPLLATVEEASPLVNLGRIRAIYSPNTAFPKWTVRLFETFDSSAARIYTTSDASDAVIQQTATEREPCNIANNRCYNMADLVTEFGWATSFYQRYFDENGTLAPNISIYTPAMVDMTLTSNNWTVVDCESTAEPQLIGPVHIIHAVGLGFDSTQQVDYRFFFEELTDPEIRLQLVREHYLNVFRQIGQCARDLGVGQLVMSLVGAGVFASNFRYGNASGGTGLQRTVWAPAFLAFLQEWWPNNSNVKISFMGAKNQIAYELIFDLYPQIDDVGYFPAMLPKLQANNPLYVNAWDPHSLPGNGNCGDNSLDGYVGRRTNIVAAGWPLTNPVLKRPDSIVRV